MICYVVLQAFYTSIYHISTPYLEFNFSTLSVEMPRVFSERVVTEPDTHAVSLSAGSRLRQQANTDRVCLLQTPDLF